MCEKDNKSIPLNNEEKVVEINTDEKMVFNLESSKTKPYDIELMTGHSDSMSNNTNNENGDD